MDLPRLGVRFFRTISGTEPVRDWLRSLSAAERKAIGDEIRAVQFGWPIGMPLVRKIEAGLWEVRVGMPSGIARVFFSIHDQGAVLLHGFVKKSQKTPATDLAIARRRKRLFS